MAIFHPGRWDGLFIWDNGLVRRRSVWPGSWDLGSLVPGSHKAGQLTSSYEPKIVLVWIIGVQRDLAQAGHPTYRAHMNRPLVIFCSEPAYLDISFKVQFLIVPATSEEASQSCEYSAYVKFCTLNYKMFQWGAESRYSQERRTEC